MFTKGRMTEHGMKHVNDLYKSIHASEVARLEMDEQSNRLSRDPSSSDMIRASPSPNEKNALAVLYEQVKSNYDAVRMAFTSQKSEGIDKVDDKDLN